MIPLYPHSGFKFWDEIETKFSFLDSARSALFLIAQEYEEFVFLIPSYTCPTVWSALEQANVNYDFVDLDNTLDFNINDLNYMLRKYNNNKIVIVTTSLFGAKIKNYKKLYPECIIVEDRAQGRIDFSNDADFQIISFGKGKMISGFSGGALYDKHEVLTNILGNIGKKNDFLISYFLSVIQKIISRMWFIFEGTSFDPEVSEKLHIDKIEPQLLCELKIKWILNTINDTDFYHRINISNYYLKNINKKYLFDIEKNTPYLRVPIKKNLSYSGVSKIKDFYETFLKANAKREKEQLGAKILIDGSYLPTHNLVTFEYAKKIVSLINE